MQDLLSSWQIRIPAWRARAKGRPPLFKYPLLLHRNCQHSPNTPR